MDISRRHLLLTAIGTVLPSTTWARETRRAPLRYTITALPLLPGGDYSAAHGINNAGQIVGLSSNGRTIISGLLRDTRAVLWERGHIRDLVKKDYASPQAFRINNQGQVLIGPQYIGSDHPSSVPAPEPYTLLWSGRIQKEWHYAQNFEAANLDDHGLIVGRSNHGSEHAAFWQDGKVHLLPMPAHTDSSQALAVGPAGQIAGTFTRPEDDGESQLFVYTQGKTRWIRPHPGHTAFYLGVITAQGDTIGTFREAKTRSAHLFICRHGSNTYEDRAALGRNGSISDANRYGQIVGTTDRGAFLYQDAQSHDLIDLIPAHSGWELYAATGINDHSQIVGNGRLHGQFRAFLLTPES